MTNTWKKTYLQVAIFLLLPFSLAACPSEETIAAFLQLSDQIVTQSPQLIKKTEAGRHYIDENRIDHFPQEYSEVWLQLDQGESLCLPFLLKDENGYFLVTSHEAGGGRDEKMFLMVCNKCGHEWFGGVFTIYCPKCGKSDFRHVRNF